MSLAPDAPEMATQPAPQPAVRPRWSGLRRVLAPATVVLLLDQISKLAIIRWLPHREGWPELDSPIGAFFRFYHSHNTGVAFGLFQGNNGLFVIVALLVVGGLLWYQTTLPAEDRWTRLALGLQVGGALGNVVDRLRLGHVTDFLDFHLGGWHWPTFNLADSAIVIGVFLLMSQLWRLDMAEQRATSRSETGVDPGLDTDFEDEVPADPPQSARPEPLAGDAAAIEPPESRLSQS